MSFRAEHDALRAQIDSLERDLRDEREQRRKLEEELEEHRNPPAQRALVAKVRSQEHEIDVLKKRLSQRPATARGVLIGVVAALVGIVGLALFIGYVFDQGPPPPAPSIAPAVLDPSGPRLPEVVDRGPPLWERTGFVESSTASIVLVDYGCGLRVSALQRLHVRCGGLVLVDDVAVQCTRVDMPQCESEDGSVTLAADSERVELVTAEGRIEIALEP
jgi:hypothetical protein